MPALRKSLVGWLRAGAPCSTRRRWPRGWRSAGAPRPAAAGANRSRPSQTALSDSSGIICAVDVPEESRWSSEATAALLAARTPSEVLQAAALCMAEEFGSDGFRWIKSRKSLERREDAGRWERIRLEPSYRNRTGSYIKFAVAQLVVDDVVLGDWRDANHLLTVVRGDGVVDTLCATSCYDMARVGFNNTVVLTRADRRVVRLSALCDQMREIVLPWFASTRDPAGLVSAVPEALLGPFAFAQDLVEFLVSRGEREQARLLIERVLSFEPKQRAAFEEGRALARDGRRPQWHTPAALGWSSAVLELM